MTSYQQIAVVGAGAWGTALANAASRAGRDVTLVARDEATAGAIHRARESMSLPGIALDAKVAISGKRDRDTAQVLLLAVPTQSFRSALVSFRENLGKDTVIVSCAKGIERGTHLFTTQIIEELLPQTRPAILSGPSFAADVARGLPTAVTLAAQDESIAAQLCQALGSATFRPYHTTDVRGVEIGGAAKNVLAIAAGIVAGKKLGASALAALTTRGFAELARFGRALGARAETLGGLSGLGDLILTCSSMQSRNFSLGVALGQGASVEAASGGKLAEGAFTAQALLELAQERNVEMPICEAVAAILDNKVGIDDAIQGLLSRPFKAEE